MSSPIPRNTQLGSVSSVPSQNPARRLTQLALVKLRDLERDPSQISGWTESDVLDLTRVEIPADLHKVHRLAESLRTLPADEGEPRSFRMELAFPGSEHSQRLLGVSARQAIFAKQEAWKQAFAQVAGAGDYRDLEILESIPELEPLYRGSAQVSEGYTVGEHTRRVLDQYEQQKKFYELDQVQQTIRRGKGGLRPGFDQFDATRFMRALLTVHDIGKSLGNPHLQHTFNTPIAGLILPLLGFSREEVHLAQVMIDHDILGSFETEGLEPAEVIERRIRGLAKDAGIPAKAFIQLQMLFYVSDASSYPGVGRLMQVDDEGRLFFPAKQAAATARTEALHQELRGARPSREARSDFLEVVRGTLAQHMSEGRPYRAVGALLDTVGTWGGRYSVVRLAQLLKSESEQRQYSLRQQWGADADVVLVLLNEMVTAVETLHGDRYRDDHIEWVIRARLELRERTFGTPALQNAQVRAQVSFPGTSSGAILSGRQLGEALEANMVSMVGNELIGRSETPSLQARELFQIYFFTGGPSALPFKWLAAQAQTLPPESYIWYKIGEGHGPEVAADQFEEWVVAKGYSIEQVRRAYAALHAASWEFYSSVTWPSRQGNHIVVVRTESLDVLETINRLDPGATPEQLQQMRRSSLECASLTMAPVIYGAQIVELACPIHRLVGGFVFNPWLPAFDAEFPRPSLYGHEHFSGVSLTPTHLGSAYPGRVVHATTKGSDSLSVDGEWDAEDLGRMEFFGLVRVQREQGSEADSVAEYISVGVVGGVPNARTLLQDKLRAICDKDLSEAADGLSRHPGLWSNLRIALGDARLHAFWDIVTVGIHRQPHAITALSEDLYKEAPEQLKQLILEQLLKTPLLLAEMPFLRDAVVAAALEAQPNHPGPPEDLARVVDQQHRSTVMELVGRTERQDLQQSLNAVMPGELRSRGVNLHPNMSPEELKDLVVAIRVDPAFINVIPTQLLEDTLCRPELARGFLQAGGRLHELPESIQSHPDVVLAFIQEVNQSELHKIPKKALSSSVVAKAYVAKGGKFDSLPEEMQRDLGVIQAAIARALAFIPTASAEELEQIPDAALKDIAVAKAYITQGGRFERLPEEVRLDAGVIRVFLDLVLASINGASGPWRVDNIPEFALQHPDVAEAYVAAGGNFQRLPEVMQCHPRVVLAWMECELKRAYDKDHEHWMTRYTAPRALWEPGQPIALRLLQAFQCIPQEALKDPEVAFRFLSLTSPVIVTDSRGIPIESNASKPVKTGNIDRIPLKALNDWAVAELFLKNGGDFEKIPMEIRSKRDVAKVYLEQGGRFERLPKRIQTFEMARVFIWSGGGLDDLPPNLREDILDDYGMVLSYLRRGGVFERLPEKMQSNPAVASCYIEQGGELERLPKAMQNHEWVLAAFRGRQRSH